MKTTIGAEYVLIYPLGCVFSSTPLKENFFPYITIPIILLKNVGGIPHAEPLLRAWDERLTALMRHTADQEKHNLIF